MVFSARSTLKKRRSSLRRKKARNSSLIGGDKPNASFVSDLMSFKESRIPFSSVPSNYKLRHSSAGYLKEESSIRMGLSDEVDFSYFSANLLVIESD